MTSDEREPDAPAAADPPPAPANPFVPRYREPWINPAKRTSAIVIAAGSAVVLLVAGLLIGLGLGGGDHHGYGPRLEMRPAFGHMLPGFDYRRWAFRHPGYGPGFGPGRPPAPPSTPPTAPVPSSSHS
jgi:hypothetical protein